MSTETPEKKIISFSHDALVACLQLLIMRCVWITHNAESCFAHINSGKRKKKSHTYIHNSELKKNIYTHGPYKNKHPPCNQQYWVHCATSTTKNKTHTHTHTKKKKDFFSLTDLIQEKKLENINAPTLLLRCDNYGVKKKSWSYSRTHCVN